MYEKFYNNVITVKVRRLADGALFPIVFGAVVFALYVLKLYVLALCFSALVGAVLLLINKDMRALIPVACLATLTVSYKNPTLGVGNYTKPFNLVMLIICGVAFVSAFVLNVIVFRKQRNYKELAKSRFFVSIVALCAMVFIGGIFSDYYGIKMVLNGLKFVSMLLIPYLVIIMGVEKREDNIRYFSIVCCVAAAVIALQLAHIYVVMYKPGRPLDSAWKSVLNTGWGISNGIGHMLAMLMPACFYMIYNEKRGYLYYILLAAIVVAMYFTLSRNALLWGAIVLVGGVVFNCIKGKNRKINLIITVSVGTVGIALIVILFASGCCDNILAFFVSEKFSGNGRTRIWKGWLKLLKLEPIFGVGFRAYQEVMNISFAYNAHNTLIQILVGTGIMGFAIYMYHRVETVKMFVKNPRTDRMLMGTMLLTGLLISLFDVFFFMYYFLIYYAITLAVVEKTLPDQPKEEQKIESAPANK